MYAQRPAVLLRVNGLPEGQVIVGAIWSTTVTSWVAVLVFPAASRAVQVTVVVPIG